MNIRYSAAVRRDDWLHVLKNADLANIFHSPEYFDIQQSLGHELLYSCCYIDDEPVAVIVATLNRFGYYQDWVEVGTKSGGCPVMIDKYDQHPEADTLKNAMIEAFARQHLKGRRFLFYPCFHLRACILEAPEWNCVTQFDDTAFLDLHADEDELFRGMGVKCRNAVRYASRHAVTARVANTREYFELFYACYKAVREKKQTQYISRDELRAKFDAFTQQGLADLWVAFREGQPLAYAFIWKYKQTINFVYGSSHENGWRYKPNNLIQWELIRSYKQEGYRVYNMWGIRNMNLSAGKDASVQTNIEGYGKFKLSFGPELRSLRRYVRV
ncbi:hypothetical protein CSA57_05445 [candidate division KSB3 bacterium]|nr:MAG: hypothetical protein CSA57_05445 [candidate division KSB3 bacterium]